VFIASLSIQIRRAGVQKNSGVVISEPGTSRCSQSWPNRSDTARYVVAGPPIGHVLSCLKRQKVVIAGFPAPKRSRPFFGSLVLAVRKKNAWHYIGHVGTGFDHKALEELHGKLLPLKTGKSPLPREAEG
jgi:hypothetical protein